MQKIFLRSLILFICFFISIPAFPAQEPQHIQLTRRDGTSIAVAIYTPKHTQSCPALAILSHGAGGNENGLSYLAGALQEDGWLAIVPGHAESGPDVLRQDIKNMGGLHDGLLMLTTNTAAYNARFMDIDAVLTWANKQCKAPFAAMLGHSMGAATVLLEAGAKNKLGLANQDRFDAYVALSPQGAGSIFPEKAWQDIHKPVLMLTGTKDKALEGEWQTRTEPHANMSPGCKWLGVIDGATHMNFAGSGFSGKTEKITKHFVLAFLDSLRDKTVCATPPYDSGISVQTK